MLIVLLSADSISGLDADTIVVTLVVSASIFVVSLGLWVDSVDSASDVVVFCMFSVVVGDCMLLLSSVSLVFCAVDSVDWVVDMDSRASIVPSVEVIDSVVCSVFRSAVSPWVLF